MQGLHYVVNAKRSVGPVAVGTTGTGQTGKIINRSGFRRVEFILGYGSVTATNAVFTVTLKEGDVTSSMTSVADADMDGTEAGAGLAAASTRTSDVSKLVTKRLGYKGMKKYVQALVKSTVTAGALVYAGAVLSQPETMPVAT